MDIVYEVLGWLFFAAPYAIAMLFAVVLMVFMIGLHRTPVTGAVGILAMFVIETFFVFLFAFSVGLSIYPQDLLFAPMALVTLVRLADRAARRRVPKSLWLLGTMMMLSFVVGLAVNGTSAGVEFRPDFYLLTSLLYFASFEWRAEQAEKTVLAILVSAVLILLIVWYRWLADATGLDWLEPLWRLTDSTGVAMRVINAGQAMLLGCAAILIVYALSSGGPAARWWLWLPPLGLTVLLLQHRSVWVAAFVPALAALAIVRRNQAQLMARLVVLGLGTLVVLVPLLASGQLDSATASVTDLAQRATSTTSGTFVGRVQGWDELLKQWASGGPRIWALGHPYGSGFERTAGPGGETVSYAPHNYFVQLLLRVGLIGLFAFIALHARLLSSAMRLQERPFKALNGYTMIGLLLSALLFDIPYAPTYAHGLLLGLVLAIGTQHDRSSGSPTVQQAPQAPARTGRRASAAGGAA